MGLLHLLGLEARDTAMLLRYMEASISNFMKIRRNAIEIDAYTKVVRRIGRILSELKKNSYRST